jgi:hypothetical protein
MSLDFKNIRNMILGLVSARGLQLLQALCLPSLCWFMAWILQVCIWLHAWWN